MKRSIEPSSAEVCENIQLELLNLFEKRGTLDVSEFIGFKLIHPNGNFSQRKKGDSTKSPHKSCEGNIVQVSTSKSSLLNSPLDCLAKVKHAPWISCQAQVQVQVR